MINMTSNINRRQSELYQLIKKHGNMEVRDILPLFPVSAPTIRKDLSILETCGMIVRTHGAVHIPSQTSQMTPFYARACLNQEAKIAIAEEAVRQIEDGDSIILDSGTTTMEIAKLLVSRSELTVFTNSLPIALTFTNSLVSVNLIGGIFLGRNLSVQGPEAEEYLRRIEVRKTFISSSGVRPGYGLVNSHPLEASLKRCMVNAGEKVYAVLDSSKFDLSSVHPFAAFSDLDYIITEKPPESEVICSQLESCDVKVLVAHM